MDSTEFTVPLKKKTHPFLPIINPSIIPDIKHKEVDAGYLQRDEHMAKCPSHFKEPKTNKKVKPFLSAGEYPLYFYLYICFRS